MKTILQTWIAVSLIVAALLCVLPLLFSLALPREQEKLSRVVRWKDDYFQRRAEILAFGNAGAIRLIRVKQT